MKKGRLSTLFMSVLIIAVLSSGEVWCGEPLISTGQTVYVPVYSYVILRMAHSVEGRSPVYFQLATNVIVRNTDPKHPITITSAEYYNTEGELLKKVVASPTVVAPMVSTPFFVEQSDESGGSGANFLVRWRSTQPVNEPIIESVTFGLRGTHSLSFVTEGKIIKE